MATIVKPLPVTWKAVIPKTGWSTNAKTFRTKRDRRTEDEMVRGAYIQRSGSDQHAPTPRSSASLPGRDYGQSLRHAV